MRSNTTPRASYIQAVDFSTMLFGRASLPEYLGVNWFSVNNSLGSPTNLKKMAPNKPMVADVIKKTIVYPNPFADNLTIESNDVIQNISVYNIMGQEVIMKTPKTNFVRLQTNSLSNGVYLIKTVTDKEEIITKITKK